MSLMAEILDRLTGIAVVREKIAETGQRVNKLAETIVDHEKRLVRMETMLFSPPRTRRLPKKS